MRTALAAPRRDQCGDQRPPGVHVHLPQRATDRYAAPLRHRSRATANHDRRPFDGGLSGFDPPQHLRRQRAAEADGDAVPIGATDLLDAQRHRLGGSLSERRWQLDRHARQRGFDHEVADLAPVIDGGPPVGRSGQCLAECGGQFATQLFRARAATDANAYRPVALRREVDHGRATEHLRRRAIDLDGRIGELDAPVDRIEYRHVVVDHQPVADELEAARHRTVDEAPQRQHELQRKAAASLRLHRTGGTVEYPVDRALRDEAQEIGRRRLRLPDDLEHLIVMDDVGREGAYTLQLHSGDRGVAREDLHPAGPEHQVAIDFSDLRPPRRIVKIDALRLHRDQELPAVVARVAEREILEVALQPHPDVRRTSGQQRAAEPPARVLAHRQRHVAGHRRRLRPAQRAGQVDLPALRSPWPYLARQRAGQICVRERDGIEPDAQARALAAPARLPLERIEGQRTREQRRQRKAQVARVDAQHAGAVVAVDRARQSLEAGPAAKGLDRECVEAQPHLPAGRRLDRPLPCDRDIRQAALRRQGSQPVTRLRIERQLACQRNPWRDLQRACGEFAALDAPADHARQDAARRRCDRVAPAQAGNGWRRRRPPRLGQGELRGGKFETVGQLAPGQPTAHRVEGKRLEVRRQPGANRSQFDIAGKRGQAPGLHLCPEPHCASAALHAPRQVDPSLPAGQAGIAQLDEHLPVPVGDARQVAAAPFRAQLERRRQAIRWHCGHAQPVPAAAGFHPKIHLLQPEFGSATRLVDPDHRRFANDDAALLQHPAPESTVPAIARHGQARDRQPATRVSPDGQARSDDLQQVRAHGTDQNGAPGQGRLDALKFQGWPPGGVVHHHLAQGQVRTKTVPVRGDAADRHRLATGSTDHPGDAIAVLIDAGQHVIAQRQHDRCAAKSGQQHQHHEHPAGRQRHPPQQAQRAQARKALERRCGAGGGGIVQGRCARLPDR